MSKVKTDTDNGCDGSADLSGSSLNKEKIFGDLKAMIKGEVLYDDLSRAVYSSAACLFQVNPIGIVQPKDKDDVIKVVQYANQNKIPLVPRGAGTSRVGNELG